MLGNQLAEQRKDDLAIQKIISALSIDPQNPYWIPLCYITLAECYSRTNKSDDALQCLEKGEQAGLDSAKLFKIRGDCYKSKQNWMASIESYKSAFRIRPVC